MRSPLAPLSLALSLLLISSAAGAKFRNFSLPCLAPLLQRLDSEAPGSVSLAFLRGPTQAPSLREDLGAVDFPITTKDPKAAAFFNQGVAYLHALNFSEAERSFRQALSLDSNNPMIFWGLSQANERRVGRARLFAQNAVRRVNNATSPRERQWIQTLGNFYDLHRKGPSELPPAKVLSDGEHRERLRQRIHDLEELVLQFPKDIEARAFLLRQLVLDEYLHGIPITSHLGVDRLAAELATDAPKHPSQHYRILLWLGTRPASALPAAFQSATLAPGHPNSWRIPAEALRANGRHHEAIEYLEASLRIHHRNLQLRALMPHQQENLGDSYLTLIQTLRSMGRLVEAQQWARRMRALPQPLTDQGHTLSRQGSEQLVLSLLQQENFEDALSLLESPSLSPPRHQTQAVARWLYWTCSTRILLTRISDAEALRKSLAELPKLPPADLTGYLASIDALLALQRKEQVDPGELILPGTLVVKVLLEAGQTEDALATAQALLEANPDLLLETAAFCEAAFASGKRVAAMAAFDRRFRENALRADQDLPILKRLAPLAKAMGLPKAWGLTAAKPSAEGLPENLDSLGPLHWAPAPAPAWTLQDHAGKKHSLKELRKGPLLVNFFLGVHCPYCLNQLNKFRPHLPKFQELAIRMVAISTDPTELLAERVPKAPKEFPYLVLADPDLETFQSFGVFDDFENGPMHATFLLSSEGKILWSDISHEPFNHPQRLLDEARRLLPPGR